MTIERSDFVVVPSVYSLCKKCRIFCEMAVYSADFHKIPSLRYLWRAPPRRLVFENEFNRSTKQEQQNIKKQSTMLGKTTTPYSDIFTSLVFTKMGMAVACGIFHKLSWMEFTIFLYGFVVKSDGCCGRYHGPI